MFKESDDLVMKLVKTSIPVLFALMGWVGNTITHNRQDIEIMKTDRYTIQDAHADMERVNEKFYELMTKQSKYDVYFEQLFKELQSTGQDISELDDKIDQLVDKLKNN